MMDEVRTFGLDQGELETSLIHSRSLLVRYVRWTAVPIAARREVLVSRHARRACLSGTAIPTVRGNIGRSTKKFASVVLRSYAMRRCSRTHRPRRNVPFASYQCQYDLNRHFLSHPRQYFLFQSMTSRLQIVRSWQNWLRNNIIPAAGRAFVEVA